jgi:hypothetical protein
MNIHIEINSKQHFKNGSSLLSFKKFVKTNKDYNLVELSDKYVNEGYTLTILEKDDNNVKFGVVKNLTLEEIIKQDKIKREKEVLKFKLKGLGLARANKSVPVAKKGSDLELYTEYIKLVKLVTFPVPSPADIKANPHNYIKSISMMIQMLRSNPNHPATTYFGLL